MSNTVKVNYALETKTVQIIALLAKETHRNKSDVIDWLAEEIWNQRHPQTKPVEQIQTIVEPGR